MGKSSSAPQGVDPIVAANQQIRVNQATLDQLGLANNFNQVTPTGSLSWTKDPTTGQWTQTTSLDPRINDQLQQQITNTDLKLGAGGNALQQILNSGTAGTPLDRSVLPLGWTGDDLQRGSLVTGIDPNSLPGIKTQLDESGVNPLQTGLAGGDAGALKDAQNSVYGQMTSRLNPQWTQSEQALKTQLTEQGITQNSDAWNKAMDDFNRQKTDAYQTANNAAVGAGNQLEGQLFGEHTTQGQFANSANQQAFTQALQKAGFSNTAAQQMFDQLMSRASLNNSAEAQGFGEQTTQANVGNAARQQALNEMITSRMTPINEANALQTGAMIPGFGAGQGSTTPAGAPNMGSLYNNQYQGQLNQYNADTGQSNSMMGAGAGIISAALIAL